MSNDGGEGRRWRGGFSGVSAKLILGGLEDGDGGAAGLVLEVEGRGLGEVVDERGAVVGGHADGEEVVAEPVGDAFGAEGGEGADAFLVHGEAALAGVARGGELEGFVGVEAILVEGGAEGDGELAAGGEGGGVDPE